MSESRCWKGLCKLRLEAEQEEPRGLGKVDLAQDCLRREGGWEGELKEGKGVGGQEVLPVRSAEQTGQAQARMWAVCVFNFMSIFARLKRKKKKQLVNNE